MTPIHPARCTLALAFALAFAIPVHAADPLGTVEATLDGEARTWVIETEADGGQSFWTETAAIVGVGLWASPEGGEGIIEDVLDITFSALVQGDSATAANAEVRLLTSDLNTFYTATEDALDFGIERLERGEDGLTVSGTFSGQLARTTFADGEASSDPGDMRDISGSFEATLPAN